MNDDQLRIAVENLVAQKVAGAEFDEGARIPSISGFIEREMARFEWREMTRRDSALPTDELNQLFRDTLAEM